MGSEAPLGAFEEQVMLAVARTGDDAYGMKVRREIERLTEREVAIGAVYATLDRLEAKKLVISRRAAEGGLSRRHFAVTPAGAQMLVHTRAMRDRMWRGVRLEAVQE